MDQLAPPTTGTKAAEEAEDIQALIDKQRPAFRRSSPGTGSTMPSRCARRSTTSTRTQIKPYFELNNVLQNGVFYAANQLYGLTFKERKDLPVYQPDVRVFEVFDKDGSPLGLFYFDYFKRDNKIGRRLDGNFVEQSKLLGTKPVIYNVANFTKPAPGQPALLSFDDVTTMFHEFGHALHGLFANQKYPSLSGTQRGARLRRVPLAVQRALGARSRRCSSTTRCNYKTGEPMPQALVDKIKKAAKFNQGYELGEVLAAAELDMQWHMLPAERAAAGLRRVRDAGAASMRNCRFPRRAAALSLELLPAHLGQRLRGRLLRLSVDRDARRRRLHWFIEHGGLTRANGQRFRDMILSRGHTEDYGPMFRAFYGKDPDVAPLLHFQGLTAGAKS